MSALDVVLPVLIGVGSGFLSGQFGIGGAMVTTPAIRLLLGRPELIAVGTPLPIIIPTAVAGAIAYARRGLIDVRAGLTVGLAGSLASVAGAWSTRLVGGSFVLVVTAVVICYMAMDMALLAFRKASAEVESGVVPAVPHGVAKRLPVGYILLGLMTGLYSGFLGLGGGFIVVPALIRWFGFDAKRAIGTSLVVVSVLAVPGSITHYFLGHVDLWLAGVMALGVVPGALLGARVTALASERFVKIAFSGLLLVVGIVLALAELGVLG
ncbi:MAG: sulfite exporter TauE/SafE family protein [Coriobacteriia bacterium]|nr:sulfite exporter TauE/SafE family protein [Coriobacteriia bacterium]